MTLMFEAHVAPIYRCVVIVQLIIRHGVDHLRFSDDRDIAVAVSRSFPGVALDRINGAVGQAHLAAHRLEAMPPAMRGLDTVWDELRLL